MKGLRYDRRALRRFLVFALPLLLLTMGLFRFALDALRLAPDPVTLAGTVVPVLPGWVVLGTWILEAVALTALYLLIQGGGGSRWTSGLLAGWIAWVFRGPLLVVTVVGLAGLQARPWWGIAFSWWLLYTLCGLVLGAAASASRLQA